MIFGQIWRYIDPFSKKIYIHRLKCSVSQCMKIQEKLQDFNRPICLLILCVQNAENITFSQNHKTFCLTAILWLVKFPKLEANVTLKWLLHITCLTSVSRIYNSFCKKSPHESIWSIYRFFRVFDKFSKGAGVKSDISKIRIFPVVSRSMKLCGQIGRF